MKQRLAHFLLFVLRQLWPLEDIIGHAVKSAARSKVATEIRDAIESADRELAADVAYARSVLAQDRERHMARLAAIDSVPHLVTPEGAAVLVATAATAATVSPQGRPQAVAKAA